MRGRSLFAAVIFVAGCGGGSQPGVNAIQQNPARPIAQLGRSWMAPDAKKHDLLYISNFYSSQVLVFSYPDGKPVGRLTGITDPEGECSSRTSHGNWWVVASGADEILEYAHGGTSPISTLSEHVGEPTFCSVEPTSGTLAISVGPDVVIFAGGKGSGSAVPTGLSSTLSLAYDNHGDLFVSGTTTASSFALLELPKGGNSFGTITPHPNIQPGSLQWHGNYLAIAGTGGIYDFAIRGTHGREIGFTQLSGASDPTQFWIAAGYVVAADAGNNDAEMWKYPAGGPILQVLHGSFDLPIGATVSVAK
jgi:hypothetical protein